MQSSRRRAIVSASLAGCTVIVAGTIGYSLIEDMSFLDALYMTTITVTTIGFKEVAPLSVPGRIFTIFMAFAGIGVILFTGTELARAILEVNLRRYIGKTRELTMIKRMSDHIIVCGHGRLGKAVAEVLIESSVPFVVVEESGEVCNYLEENRIPIVQGDATQQDVLLAAGIERAKTFLSCLGDDAHNVYAILLARQLQPNITIIGLAVEDGAEERLRLAGAHQVINPYKLGGKRLALTAIKPQMMDFIDTSLLDSNMELELSEITVRAGSELEGRTLAEAHVRRNFGIIIIARKRGDDTCFNPSSDFRMQKGDILVGLGPLDALERAERVAAGG
jgi:voltage-gated potassium channel